MFETRVSERLRRAAAAARPITEFVNSPIARRAEDPRVANFLFGNPHEPTLPAFTESIQRWAIPRHKDWFAYQTHQRPAQEAVAAGLRERFALPFAPEDVVLTTGSFGGLSMLLSTLVDRGDEVIFLSPPWFFYEAMILMAGATPVPLRLRPPSFDLDVDGIAAAITPSTRAVIINSAQNPTGRVYPAAALAALGAALTRASAAQGRPIWLLSDESYSRIVFDGVVFETPVAHYPHSFLIYTYGKVLLTPGQRVGYVAMPSSNPSREALRPFLFSAQMVQGWTFPSALMQYALPDLESMSIDVAHLQVRRDRLVEALGDAGYEVARPESTFYLLPASPIPDDVAFCERLAARDVLCMPGRLFDLPGYVRISITASDEMIDRAIPVFRSVKEGGVA
jgi:aspartate aminotransferase